jgi:hypothetical protein
MKGWAYGGGGGDGKDLIQMIGERTRGQTESQTQQNNKMSFFFLGGGGTLCRLVKPNWEVLQPYPDLPLRFLPPSNSACPQFRKCQDDRGLVVTSRPKPPWQSAEKCTTKSLSSLLVL